jgi:hypothetical protein
MVMRRMELKKRDSLALKKIAAKKKAPVSRGGRAGIFPRRVSRP